MLGIWDRSPSTLVRHVPLSSRARLRVATRCRSANATVKETESQPQKSVKVKVKGEPAATVPNEKEVTAVVAQYLKDKGYADDALCVEIKKALKDKFAHEQQENSNEERLEWYRNNIAAMGLVITSSDDVRYIFKQQPLLVSVDVLAWAGLLQALGLSFSQILTIDPHLVLDRRAGDCLPAVEHLQKHCSDLKQLSLKVKKTPRLLTVDTEVMLQAEEAFKEAGLKPSRLSLLLQDRLDIFYEYSRRPQPFMTEVQNAVAALHKYNIDPNDVLPAIASLVVRKEFGKRVEERLLAFEKLGLDKDEVSAVISKAPGALAVPPAELQRRFSHVRVVLRNDKDGLLEYPQFLQCNITKDIAPTLAYLVLLGEEHRVTGGPKDGKVSLELLAKESVRLLADPKYVAFQEEYKRGLGGRRIV